jgi:hypothetical protein
MNKETVKWEIVTKNINGEEIEIIQTTLSSGHLYMRRLDSNMTVEEFFGGAREIEEIIASRFTVDVPPQHEILVSNDKLDMRG